MYFFFKNKEGLIDYSSTSESNYSEENLLKLFKNLRNFNKDFEMDERYQMFLREGLVERGGGMTATYSEVKRMFEEKGFKVAHRIPWRDIL